jgi:hypothetical protein
MNTGGVKCWGYNSWGQLGDATNTNRHLPTDVSGLVSGIAAISAGTTHTCALTTGGGVKCWGENINGELGDNLTTSRSVPGDVLVMLPAKLVAVQSRKIHGAAGPFDLPVDSIPVVTGAVTVEPRTIGTGHLIVFQFDNVISVPGAVDATGSNGFPIGASAITSFNNEVLVTLTGIADTSRVKVSLTGVNGSVNTSASIGFLVGDVNNSRADDPIDTSAVKARSGQIADASNFKFDVNTSGLIGAADILAIKVRSGQMLAP